MDSVVMCELFNKAGFKFGIAHCNFKLRGDESDGDQNFVKALADKLNVNFHTIDFETAKIAEERKISTQMAARDLRYEWFEKILKENTYKFIATAHHKDDQVETLLINLLRGTGIAGLHGILPKQKNLIRPMLEFSRDHIEKYVLEHSIKFREDSSNASDKYLRNKIRHQLVPILEEMKSGSIETIHDNILRFRDAELIYQKQIQQVKNELLVKEGKYWTISIPKLQEFDPISTYLYELLKDFGFSFSQCEDILTNIEGIAGKKFRSESHELLKDRDSLIIRMISEVPKNETLSLGLDEITAPIKLKLKKIRKTSDFRISRSPDLVQFDSSQISFPLQLRKWKNGDKFYPLGCTYKKKVSDFFIDKKVNLFEKENAYVLCSGEDIIWVIGYQIDNRFRIRPETSEMLQIEFVKD